MQPLVKKMQKMAERAYVFRESTYSTSIAGNYGMAGRSLAMLP